MNQETKLLLGSTTVVFLGVLVAFTTDTLTGSNLAVATVVGFGFPFIWWMSKKGYLQRIQQDLSNGSGSQEFGKSRDFKEMWESLQEWEKKDPRNTELVWHPNYTRWNTDTLPHTTDVDFLFVSLITPFKYDGVPVKKYPIHICFEAKTGFIIKHDAVKKKSELKGDPFKQVPLVKNARNQVHSTRQMMSRLKSSSVGRVNVEGQTPIDSLSVDDLKAETVDQEEG